MPRGRGGAQQQRRDAAGDGAGPSTSAGPSYRLEHKHTFVQYMMQKGWVRQRDAKDLVRKLTGSEAAYDAMVGELNGELGSLSLTLKQMRFVNDGQLYIGFVNTAADEQAKLGTQLSHAQLAFFRQLLETLATTPDDEGRPEIASTDALNLSCAPATQTQQQEAPATQAARLHLSLREKEALLERLVDDGWVARSPRARGYLCLGVRTFLELGEELVNMAEVPECNRAKWLEVL